MEAIRDTISQDCQFRMSGEEVGDAQPQVIAPSNKEDRDFAVKVNNSIQFNARKLGEAKIKDDLVSSVQLQQQTRSSRKNSFILCVGEFYDQ